MPLGQFYRTAALNCLSHLTGQELVENVGFEHQQRLFYHLHDAHLLLLVSVHYIFAGILGNENFFLGPTGDLGAQLGLVPPEALMHVILLIALLHFPETIHIQLNKGSGTCLIKDAMLECR